MSSAATRRKPAQRRAPANAKRRRPARANRPSILDRAVAALPVSEHTLRRVVAWTILAALAAGALVVSTWFGLPQAAYAGIAEGVGRTGLRVGQIEVKGLKRMDRMSVYAMALDQQSRAMPLVDLEAVRQRLLTYGWIADARVSRRLPDTLVIDIVERQPAAIWQNEGQLMLIDAKGVLLEPVSPQHMPDLPLVIGDGANEQEPALHQLMEAAPALKPLVRAATWIGNRRWDLIFTSGERLQLPEGKAESARALAKFAALEGTQGLLGKGYIRLDMRDPSRLVVRMPDADDKVIDGGASAPKGNQPAVGGTEA
ncbi:cell division protein FtsQ/DivIB [Stakelama sp. CBK3Z-3]|uniref:Cell division protein FtsQ n=1 Tax=Stakelama flava TaxID=2860338 RepID=A0ABS6XHM5_9SPHN|nr:cell division protein FtsQ/DivIB [Stakelama flava]MBW4329717.1 cell division protein FtsQ/DivIB [Stakelama flava]